MDNPTLLLQRQRMLLEIEYNHEKEEFRKHTGRPASKLCSMSEPGWRITSTTIWLSEL